MLILAFVFYIFAFLCAGAVVFVLAAILKQTRRFALSAALWCTAWAPCIVTILFATGAVFTARSMIGDERASHGLERALFALGGLSFGVGLVAAVVVTTFIAWLHQAVVRRFPFRLFRLYAMLVVAGIGSVFGWAFNFYMLDARFLPRYWILVAGCQILLIAAFGAWAYRHAATLRGEWPTRFNWTTREEYDPPSRGSSAVQ